MVSTTLTTTVSSNVLFGFGFNSETYNLEYTHYNPKYEVSVSSSAGRIDRPRLTTSENAFASSFVHYLGGHSRLGASVLMGESPQKRRFLSGLHGVLSFSEEWLGEFELDRELSYLSTNATDEIETVASFLKFGNYAFKGFLWYLVFEHMTQKFRNSWT